MTHFAVFCDFDETAAVQNVAHRLLAQFAGGRDRQHSDAMRAGQISFREYQERAFNETRVPVREMEQFVRADTVLRPGLVETIAAAKTAGASFTIVSAGLDFYINSALKTQRIAGVPVIAVEATRPSSNKPLRYDYAEDGNGCARNWATCKCMPIRKAQAQGAQTVFIGDGIRSDACAAGKADFVFAREKLLAHCQQTGIKCTPITDTLYPVAAFLKQQPLTLAK